MTGKIRNLKENFGFIRDERGGDYFFHGSELNGIRFDQLKIGDAVEFEEQQSPKGPRAANVRIA